MSRSARLIPLLLLAGALCATAENQHKRRHKYVQTSAQFRLDMEAHIDRLPILGDWLLDHYPESFPDVKKENFLWFLQNCHDQSKINRNLDFLKRYGEANRSPIYKGLFELLYSGGLSGLKPKERKKAQDLIDRLNRIDRRVAVDCFKRRGIDPESAEARQILKGEKVVDGVDRNQFPISKYEEFGTVLRSGGKFHTDPELQKLSRGLERAYGAIVSRETPANRAWKRKLSWRQAQCVVNHLHESFAR